MPKTVATHRAATRCFQAMGSWLRLCGCISSHFFPSWSSPSQCLCHSTLVTPLLSCLFSKLKSPSLSSHSLYGSHSIPQSSLLLFSIPCQVPFWDKSYQNFTQYQDRCSPHLYIMVWLSFPFLFSVILVMIANHASGLTSPNTELFF